MPATAGFIGRIGLLALRFSQTIKYKLRSQMPTDADVVAVIHTRHNRLAIWHVVIDANWPMSRLSGAWVDMPASASTLCAQRYLLPFRDSLPVALTHLEPASAGQLDANGTRDAIANIIDKLDLQHQESPTKAGKARAAISWPSLPEPLDWTALPEPPHGVADDPLTSETIAVARWVSRLADIWASVETTRLSRDYLADGDTTPRPMPVALRF
jgi:hypothetical protein